MAEIAAVLRQRLGAAARHVSTARVPDWRVRVIAIGEPALLSNMILRAVAEHTEIEGHVFRKGDRLLIAIRNILHQRGTFERPDSFDLGRAIPAPLRRFAFGAGVHACLGVGLALAEARQVAAATAASSILTTPAYSCG